MTAEELKDKVIGANANLDLCLDFLNQRDMRMFLQYLSQSCKTLETCRTVLTSDSCDLGIEVRDVIMSFIRSAGVRACKFIRLGYRFFDVDKYSAALEAANGGRK